MTKIISILAVMLSSVVALAHSGPLTEQQKKDFLEEFKSAGRVVRLYADAKERKTPTSDEAYEKMYALIQEACKFAETVTTKDDVETVVLEASEMGCPVVMKSIDQTKRMEDGVTLDASKIAYQAGDLMKTLNDVIEMQELAHGTSTWTINSDSAEAFYEGKSEGFIVSQKNGKSDFKSTKVSSAEYVGDKMTKFDGEFSLNTMLGDVEVELKSTYKIEDGVTTKEIFLNGEKIEIDTDLTSLFQFRK